MRVVNTSIYRNYTSSMNNVQARLNKSMNKISSGREYESAAESPISYYKGKTIDSQYQDLLGKTRLMADVKARLEQQEAGAYDIQSKLLSKDAKNSVIQARTETTSEAALLTLRDKLLQTEHNMVNDLQTQYQDYYVYGGNDVSTPPFSLSQDGRTLTFSHVFPGDPAATKFVMELNDDGKFELTNTISGDPGKTHTLKEAMSEQGFIDLGYGDIRDRDTLLDTYTGGMNILTGLTSENIKNNASLDDKTIVEEYLSKGPLGLTARAVQSIEKYIARGDHDRSEMHSELGEILSKMLESEHDVSTVYSDLGNKYNLIENLETKLKKMTDSLQEQYNDAVGADPYTAIYEMFNNQYSYNAALQVGSNLMSSSLFDFIR